MSGTTTAGQWRALRDAIMAFYRTADAAMPDGPATRDFLARVAGGMSGCDVLEPVRAAARRIPAARLLQALVSAPVEPRVAPLVDAFLAVEPAADWLQNPNYTRDTMGQSFLDAYGYVEILGPGRVMACADLRIGFLLLGPGVLYPTHGHPAAEVYHVVAGSAQWWRDGQDWREVGPGVAIHHRPDERHATRASSRGVLALYAWAGDIGPAAELRS